MRMPIGHIATLAASGTFNLGTVPIVKLRDFFVTIRGTFNASATGDLRVNALFSPDGKNYDTDACDYFDLTCSAGNTRQTTNCLAVPPHGTVVLQVENKETSETATNIKVWYSIQSWPDIQPQYGGIPPNVDFKRNVKFRERERVGNPGPGLGDSAGSTAQFGMNPNPPGTPKTEEQRRTTHQASYGEEKLPPRGTGLKREAG